MMIPMLGHESDAAWNLALMIPLLILLRDFFERVLMVELMIICLSMDIAS